MTFFPVKAFQFWLTINLPFGHEIFHYNIWTRSFQPFWLLLDPSRRTGQTCIYVFCWYQVMRGSKNCLSLTLLGTSYSSRPWTRIRVTSGSTRKDEQSFQNRRLRYTNSKSNITRRTKKMLLTNFKLFSSLLHFFLSRNKKCESTEIIL